MIGGVRYTAHNGAVYLLRRDRVLRVLCSRWECTEAASVLHRCSDSCEAGHAYCASHAPR